MTEIARLIKKLQRRGAQHNHNWTQHGQCYVYVTCLRYSRATPQPYDYESCSRILITVYSFGGPRVGNVAFKDRCEELGLRILRVVNIHDVVKRIAGVIFNEIFRLWESVMGFENFPWNYSYVGVELPVDHRLYSQFSKPKSQHLSCIQDLEMYLHLLTRRSIHEHHSCSLHSSESSHDSFIRNLRGFFEKHVVFDGFHLILGLIIYSCFLDGSNLPQRPL